MDKIKAAFKDKYSTASYEDVIRINIDIDDGVVGLIREAPIPAVGYILQIGEMEIYFTDIKIIKNSVITVLDGKETAIIPTN